MNFDMVGHQSIEIDVGTHFITKVPVVVKSVDFEDFDDELGNIFQVNLEGNVFFQAINLFACRIKFDINAVLEFLKFRRRKKRSPVGWLADSIDDFCFCKDTAKP